jgi:hypothetical protein
MDYSANKGRQVLQTSHNEAALYQLLFLALVSCGIMLPTTRGYSAEASQRTETKGSTLRSQFSRAVDWYKRPPPSFNPNRGVTLPVGLINPVPEPLREVCATLLNEQDFVSLTNEQAKQDGSPNDPSTILEAEIANLTRSLLVFEEHPISERDAAIFGYNAAELKSQKKRRADNIVHLRLRIAQLNAWRHKLKPYLIRAVELQPDGIFGGTLDGRTFVVLAGGLGPRRRAMHRCPVVVFLPIEPHNVYTAVGLMN